ncbi:type I-F CRISPR-associated protein Csy1 [Salinisphaera sp. SWV1]|uniref:type I-F CRISPR-associated protein Csy1 n=1 Tax=Salinisphaera sp. SWV1 TaxID=3454139 RepID=UPI003F82CCE0
MTQETKEALRYVLETFLAERRDNKLQAAGDDEAKQTAIRAQFQRESWLEDAARRAGQLQVVTHSLKPIHPDAKGTNLYAPLEAERAEALLGSHVLGKDFDVDVVGNAAALDVFKMLQLTYDGSTFLERVKAGDTALQGAFSDNADDGKRWMDSFTAITEGSGVYASHTRGKQLYWLTGEQPTDDAEFRLLAPLYATSLAHRVFETINDDRFSDTAKAARKARYDDKPFETGYCDYPGLAVQHLGGSNTQNVSMLNAARRGTNYLLSSQPPTWRSQNVRPPLHMRSAFRLFGFRSEVRRVVRELRRLFGADPRPLMDVRDRRDELTEALIDELLVFSVEIQNLAPGWSVEPECRLDPEQQYWLDPGRARTDTDFRAARTVSDWPAVVRHEFAAWLNRRLSRPLMMSDTEHRAWAEGARTDMNLQRFIEIDRAWMDKLADELDQFEADLPGQETPE